jgi:hypothetical protein
MIAWMRTVAGWALLLLALAACGTFGPEPTATFPRPTATPISTPLPGVATEIPAGIPENPLQLVLVPADPQTAPALEDNLEDFLLETSNVTVDVILADSPADALGAVCNSGQGTVSAAFVDGITYAAAAAQECALPQVQLERGRNTGEPGVLLVNSSLGVETADVFSGRTFCRLGLDDLYSWQLPTLVMRTAGLDISDIRQIRDYESVDEMLSAVANGTCTGTGLPEAVWEANEDEFSESISVINTTPDIPYSVLIMPFEAPLAARLSLTDALVNLEDAPQVALSEATPEATVDADTDTDTDNDEETSDDSDDSADAEATESGEMLNLLLPFFGEGEFVRVEEGDFDDLRDFLDESGLNLNQLGQ